MTLALEIMHLFISFHCNTFLWTMVARVTVLIKSFYCFRFWSNRSFFSNKVTRPLDSIMNLSTRTNLLKLHKKSQLFAEYKLHKTDCNSWCVLIHWRCKHFCVIKWKLIWWRQNINLLIINVNSFLENISCSIILK